MSVLRLSPAWRSMRGRAGVALISGWACLAAAPPMAPEPTPIPPNGAVLTGRVLYNGDIPPVELVPVDRDRAFCGDTVPNEALVIDQASRGVAGAVISLEGAALTPRESRRQVLVIENRTCRFLPRVSAVEAGTILEIRNADPIMHNTHIRKKSRFGENVLNVVQPARGHVEKRVTESGLLDVRCDAHPFMRAAIHMFDHPYFAVTGADGRYDLGHVPAGQYRVKLWHEGLRMQERAITIPATGALSVDFHVGPAP
jgi:plastocyanin